MRLKRKRSHLSVGDFNTFRILFFSTHSFDTQASNGSRIENGIQSDIERSQGCASPGLTDLAEAAVLNRESVRVLGKKQRN